MSVNGFTFDDGVTFQKYNYESLDNKPDLEEGTFPNVAVGQLVGDTGITDTEPYFSRPSASIGDREFDTLVGGSLGWNQLVPTFTGTYGSNGVIYTFNADGTVVANGEATGNSFNNFTPAQQIQGHKVLICGCPAGGSGSTYYLRDGYTSGKYDTGNGLILEAKANTIVQLCVDSGTTVNNLVFKPNLIDLTTLFGSTIADYIYSLEQATAGAGVAWVRKYLPNEYYTYCAPTLKHVTGVSAHVMTGFNQWDEVAEVGTINGSNGNNLDTGSDIRSKNFIPVLPGGTYYFKSPVTSFLACQYDASKNFISAIVWGNPNAAFTLSSNCHYLKIATYGNQSPTYNHDICINLSDASKNGTYEPYVQHSYPIDSSWVGMGIPKLDSDGKLYFDGDRYASDGTVTERFVEIDLGTLGWEKSSSGNKFYARTPVPYKWDSHLGLICAKYVYDGVGGSSTGYYGENGTIRYNWFSGSPGPSAYEIYIHDESYTDAATFKTAMSGAYLVYEKAIPTTSTATPFTSPQICDKDGTEEYVTTGLVPVGHETFYPKDLRGELERVSIAVPKAPTSNGTYTLKCTVASGVATYSWM